VLRAQLRSDDSHGIGSCSLEGHRKLLFFLMNNEKNYRSAREKGRRIVPGAVAAALDNVNGFDLGRRIA